MIATKIIETVKTVLADDVGSGDITAALVPEQERADAQIISREHAVICGKAWANEVFRQINPGIQVKWLVDDGDLVRPEQCICTLNGPARSLLTAERCALNFLQTLSATATTTWRYKEHLHGTKAVLLDTRKTIPGLRQAQKYAVKCGGGENHRMGLFDAFLIKENHIAACGSITAAVNTAKQQHPGVEIEVEVETLDQLQEAIEAKADIVMLDNFEIDEVKTAVKRNKGRVKLEASGAIEIDELKEYAETGVDYISIGALTKNIKAIDLSMRFNAETVS